MPRHINWPVWNGMKQRCTNANRFDHKYYGGKGVRYAAKWETLEGFNDDMGARPTTKHTLDRADPAGDYTKENCRWATRLEQAETFKHTRVVEFEGRKQSIAAWCREQNISRSTVASRELRNGWPILAALGLVPCA
ncbi:MAG: hypothetical protein A2Y38_20065 [Spirochaetes bacterium GWB1_59_5]|nr:MAG: hypothetical protein A2Y38_20065 [Spirochaetes bacterium GWB1_59_5]